MKFKYLIILIAIASLVTLYFLSLVSQPVLISLSALHTYNGQQVIVQGVVTEYRITIYGSQIITIRDMENSTNSVMLYIEGEASVEYGDTVQAIGEVQQYKEQWEISVNNPQFVTILQKWNNQSFPLWQLAENPDKYLGTNVNVTGIATQKHESSFSLTDPEGKYSIDVFYDSSCSHQFSKDDSVAVAGRFLYETKTFQYVLKATENTHGIWKLER
jgi:DNA/RNA endonuclease YhcR with UshA esterase domain